MRLDKHCFRFLYGFHLASVLIMQWGCNAPEFAASEAAIAKQPTSLSNHTFPVISTIPSLTEDSTTTIENPNEIKHDRYALLIGCSVYPNLPEELWLQGPSADVAITKNLLLDIRFGFNEAAIVTLVYENPPDTQPTYQNIVNYFERLADQVKAGDQVFVLLAGHGGQQPNRNPDDDPEADGLDELFVPQDISGWNRTDKLEHRQVILDDQIGRWLQQLRDAGAFVFFVSDSCHSGSMNRGAEEPVEIVRSRALPLVYAQEDILLAPSNEVGKTDSTLDTPTDIVSLYAVPAQFAAREQPMPPEDPVGTSGVHGRLSYTLNEILRTSRRPLSYRELVQQLRWKHARWNWNPFPYAEGSNLDRMVLGRESFPDRSSITLMRTGQKIDLNIGSLHQIQPGTILAVYPPAGEAGDEQVSGYVQIESASATSSQANPSRFGSEPAVAAEQLPIFGRCEIVYSEWGDARLPVMIIERPDARPSISIRDQVNQTLKEICVDPSSLVREVDKPEECEIFVVVSSNQIVLRRKHEPIALVPASNREAVASLQSILPFPIAEDLKQQLATRLLMISRAVNLVRLAESETCNGNLANPSARQDQMQLDVQFCEAAHSEYRNVADPTELELRNGDKLRVTVVNHGNMNLDVTGLIVESGFAIKALTLKETDDSGKTVRLGTHQNRIVAGDETKFFELVINDNTIGMESLVLIAVPGVDSLPANFNYLSQTGLQTALSRELPSTRGNAASGFQMLLESTFYSGATTRGPMAAEPPAVIRRISWKVVKDDVSTTSK